MVQISLEGRNRGFLQSEHRPVKQQGINLWYKSPLREETEASFKVNTERNQWYDFGLGKGGGIIELAAHLYATDHVPYLLEQIAEQTPHVHPVSFSFGKQSSSEPSFQQLEIVPLSSPALLAYLQGRGINIELAKREWSEARFTHNGKRYFAIAFPNGSGCTHNGKRYFAIAFPNGSGGYEIRNRYFKGCIAPKEISHIRQSGKARNTCYVFEGFMDYLSFLTLRQESCPNYPELDGQDYICDLETRELPKLTGIGPTGQHRIELRIECKQGSLSVGKVRTHPLLFRQGPCRYGTTPATPQGIRHRPVHPRRFADLWRMQGLERILTETGGKERAVPVRQGGAQPITGEEERLPVIAHYNYTLRFRSCGLSRGD